MLSLFIQKGRDKQKTKKLILLAPYCYVQILTTLIFYQK